MRSASNRQLTLLRKLNRKKYRQKEQHFLLEGERAVQQVLKNRPGMVRTLFFEENQQIRQQENWEKTANGIDAFTLSSSHFSEVSDTDNPQGVLALCKMPEPVTWEAMSGGQGVIVALDAIRDPGNLGTIIRTSAWFGAGGIVSGKGTVDQFHPKVVRSTAGATGTTPYLDGDLTELLDRFEQSGWSVILLDAGPGAVSLRELQPTGKTVLVTGNEARGIRSELVTGNRIKVQIPPSKSHPDVESLNAAIATSIALYEMTGP